MAKYLYVKEDVAYAEYFIAPDISSLAYAAYYGAYLGELTGRTVQGISGDKNTFLEYKLSFRVCDICSKIFLNIS